VAAHAGAKRSGVLPPDLAAAMRRPPLAAIFRGRLLRVTLLAALVFTLMNTAFYAFSSHITPFLTSSPADGGLGWTQKQSGPVFGAMTVVAGLSAAFAGFLSDRVGRRHVFSALCVVGALTFVGLFFVLLDLDPAHPGPFWAAVVLATVGFGVNGVVGSLFSELYPTHLRATGPGFVSNVGKFLASGAPLLGGWIIRVAGEGAPRRGWAIGLSAPAIGFVVLAVLIWTLPRVTGRPLEAIERDDFLG
jgi:MFS family permease